MQRSEQPTPAQSALLQLVGGSEAGEYYLYLSDTLHTAITDFSGPADDEPGAITDSTKRAWTGTLELMNALHAIALERAATQKRGSVADTAD